MSKGKVLDLFCGLGGWSEGFALEGFDVTGVDIVDVGYPYKLILKDIRELDGNDFKGYDVIVGSPPCRDFSQITTTERALHWRIPVDPQRGLELVKAFLRIVEEAKPRYWLMENVPGLVRHFKPPVMRVRIARTMTRCFWGDFPMFLVSQDWQRPNSEDIKGPNRSWVRAKILDGTSRPFARVIAQSLPLRNPLP